MLKIPNNFPKKMVRNCLKISKQKNATKDKHRLIYALYYK